jgi:cytochrome c
MRTNVQSGLFRLIVLSLAVVVLGSLVWSRWDETPVPARAVPGGDVELGRQAIDLYGCIACHSVPGVRGPSTYVGPPLDHWDQRRYIAGRVPNELDNLLAWIRNPQAIDPQTAMPNLNVSEEDARHIAAYLYTLE